MNDKTTHNQVTGESETARFICTRFPSAATAADELCTTKRKEPDMGKRNTNSWEGQRPRCPHVRITGNEDDGQPACANYGHQLLPYIPDQAQTVRTVECFAFMPSLR